jgi:hypothetical protein
MTILDSWLKRATRHLSKASIAQVRTEIQQHCESARETAMNSGSTSEEADRLALTSLGDAMAANRQYRKVLLTSAEARMLREGNWEARAVCSRPWLKWLFLIVPLGALLGAAKFFLAGAFELGWVLLAGGIGTGVLCTALFLPVYTPFRGRIFRCVKWIVLLGLPGLAFGPSAFQGSGSWLLISSLWPLIWIEWTRISIRRKLPVAEWPKQLFL